MNLYIAHVGYYDPEIGIYELHANIHVVAPDIKNASNSIKAMEIFKNNKMHIDGFQELFQIDGHNIRVEKSSLHYVNRSFGYDDIKLLG